MRKGIPPPTLQEEEGRREAIEDRGGGVLFQSYLYNGVHTLGCCGQLEEHSSL